jgi:hypothetical protein
MKRIIYYCLWSVLALIPQIGNATDTTKVSVAPRVQLVSDSLLVVDEDQLVASLIKMVQLQQQLHPQRSAELQNWLHTQLLVESLANPQTISVKTSSQESSVSLRLSKLERTVQQLVETQRIPQQDLTPVLQQMLYQQALILQQLNRRPEAKRNTAAIVPIPLPVNATRDDSLVHQIKVLQAQIAALQNNSDADTTAIASRLQTISPNLTIIQEKPSLEYASSLGSDVVNKATERVLIPADFERSVFFSVSSVRLGADAKQKLAETLNFLNTYPQVCVVIRGYASPEGARSFNLQLAQKRQKQVQQYLLQHGIAAHRVLLENFGINRAQIGAQVARRVDISLKK